MTEDEKKEIQEIVDLLTKGILTDEKLREAYVRLKIFKYEWLFGKVLEVKEIN